MCEQIFKLVKHGLSCHPLANNNPCVAASQHRPNSLRANDIINKSFALASLSKALCTPAQNSDVVDDHSVPLVLGRLLYTGHDHQNLPVPSTIKDMDPDTAWNVYQHRRPSDGDRHLKPGDGRLPSTFAGRQNLEVKSPAKATSWASSYLRDWNHVPHLP